MKNDSASDVSVKKSAGSFVLWVLCGLAVSCVSLVVLIIIYVIALKPEVSSNVELPMYIMVGIACFAGSFAAARGYGQKGFLVGICNAFVFFITFLLIAVAMNSAGLTSKLYISLFVMVALSEAGAITAVNVKKRFRR